ncbi:hypothetical protein CDD82_5301 [Ophiocordyceps australis]|uniref:SH3 domain-containing protein n=1 Tax=Ophiocordyceps australis TaxID=1399860 RepID=A0A2C5Z1L0_9HYPO|nr:hypothetical protein CDD82_5301 [Ophiocordyceps australis]
MASRGAGEAQARPDIGDTLIVIRESQALWSHAPNAFECSDELSLGKGDRVELIERDDEFGDGWFLGRHLANGNTGLFPEVYTRPAPKSAFTSSKPLAPVAEISHARHASQVGSPPSKPVKESRSPPVSPTASRPPEASTTLPLNSAKADAASASTSRLSSSAFASLGSRGQDSQVLNDTLHVIDEHITHLRTSPSNGALRAAGTDSGSEYSATVDQRMSYIQGEETDEEEERPHTRQQVQAWTPDEVAQHLFTAGVEKHHCDIFREQEISGEVLLGMDQSSLFIKAFDLGSVGRRLKTWHKIKELQDSVSSQQAMTRRTTVTYNDETGNEDSKHSRKRTSTVTNPASATRPVSTQSRRLSATQQTPKASPTMTNTPPSPKALRDSPTRPNFVKRPSAASVRDLHHSRRHSSTDFRLSGPAAAPVVSPDGSVSGAEGVHKKVPSFDRNWTLGSALSQPQGGARPLSSTGFHELATGTEADLLQDSAVDLDRGYFSGTDADGRKRNVLRKRDSTAHSQKSSYAEEQRVRSATALSRHSRFGSVDSFRDMVPSPAVQKYYGIQPTPHRRTASTNTAESSRHLPQSKDGPPPTVTNLDSGSGSGRSQGSPVTARHPGFNSDWLSSVVNKPMGLGRPGMRAISDRLTMNRSRDVGTPDPAFDSPARTGSSTPSAGASLDLESPGTGKTSSTSVMPPNKANRKKGKKETSAYTRGLEKISPLEAKAGADYYGWMKKKSSNLMTTWKPRLFVLKGRRMAYYYSEDDDQEKGLIDISFHRVLPADNERLTGFHATITGAGNAAGGESSGALEKGDDSVFIFKLVPPRTGLSKAVNFTKPTVHYFAVPNLQQGRLWMAALMKATIERDDGQPITSTYQQKTISLAKAKLMRHRPPALMNLDEGKEEEHKASGSKKVNGLGIFGESDSGVSGMDKLGGPKANGADAVAGEDEGAEVPQTA